MDTTAEVLVIILSIVLSLFLVIAIVALVLFIKILKEIKHIVQKASSIADKAETVGEFFQKTAGPAALAKLVSNIVHSFRSTKKGKEGD